MHAGMCLARMGDHQADSQGRAPMETKSSLVGATPMLSSRHPLRHGTFMGEASKPRPGGGRTSTSALAALAKLSSTRRALGVLGAAMPRPSADPKDVSSLFQAEANSMLGSSTFEGKPSGQ